MGECIRLLKIWGSQRGFGFGFGRSGSASKTRTNIEGHDGKNGDENVDGKWSIVGFEDNKSALWTNLIAALVWGEDTPDQTPLPSSSSSNSNSRENRNKSGGRGKRRQIQRISSHMSSYQLFRAVMDLLGMFHLLRSAVQHRLIRGD